MLLHYQGRDLFVPPQARRAPKAYNRPAEGLDTETRAGYARIVADSSAWQHCDSITDALRWLTLKKRRTSVNCFYNLTFDAEVLLKHDLGTLEQLRASGRATCGAYDIFYIPKKVLRVRDPSRHCCTFYDIAQFYGMSLKAASEKYLGLPAHALKEHRAALFDNFTAEQIGEYCRSDAELTRQLSERWLDVLRGLNVHTRKLISAGYISQLYSLQNADLPTARDLPRCIAQFYLNAYRGGWFECFKRGLFTASCFDITSAYPHALRQLPDLRRGTWHRDFKERAALGVVRARVTRTPPDFLPLSVLKLTLRIYPTFDVPAVLYLTLGEYDALHKPYGLEPLAAWSFVPDPDAPKPYAQLVDRLFKLKQDSKADAGRYECVKRIINSLYGKCAQKTPLNGKYRAGTLFNPCYAAETTARCRLQVYEDFRRYAEDIIAVHTDSVLIKGEPEVELSEDLGGWQLKQASERLLMLQTGVYQFAGEAAHTRGFRRTTDLYKACDTNASSACVSYERPIHFKEALAQHSPERIGVFEKIQKQVTVSSDLKRLWPRPVLRMCDLLKQEFASAPVPLSMLRGSG